MISKDVLDYLDNHDKPFDKKIELIKNLNLNYTNVFMLMDRYSNNPRMYTYLHSLIYYTDSSLSEKIKKQKRKSKERSKKEINKYMKRRNDYD